MHDSHKETTTRDNHRQMHNNHKETRQQHEDNFSAWGASVQQVINNYN